MGSKIVSGKDYEKFLNNLDKKLEKYFKEQSKFVCCKKGCSLCCEKGDYPLTEPELHYMMQGYTHLEYDIRKTVQKNIQAMSKGGACPFLINKLCSIYKYRPLVCRVHGLAYKIQEHVIKLPYCAEEGMNFAEVYKDGKFLAEPVEENLDTIQLLSIFDYGEYKNLYDWIKSCEK